MLIGLVYDLRDDYRAMGYSEEAVAEFDSLETIDALTGALSGLGHRVERIGHGRALAARLVAGARFDLVFSIAEGLEGRSREAQVPALCELFGQPHAFSDALTMAVCHDKSVAKRLVRDAGVPTADFAVLESEADATRIDLPFPVFVKPLAEGTGKGCEPTSKAHDRAALAATTGDLVARFRQPVIVEPFLPGREFTVGVVGTGDAARIVGICEIVLNETADADIYSLRNKEECESLVTYRLAEDPEAQAAGEVALMAHRALGCRDASRADLRSDAAGRPQFLEVNPIAGLHPTHSDLPIIATLAGKGYDWLIAQILDSARSRLALDTPAKLSAVGD